MGPQTATAPRRRPSREWADARYAAWDLPTAAEKVLEGFPIETLISLQARLGLTARELASTLLMTPRTLTRRTQRAERLPVDESERVYRLARLFEDAARVLGGEEEARAWMREPNYALGEAVPLDLVRTQPGAELVRRVLGQIEYGIFA